MYTCYSWKQETFARPVISTDTSKTSIKKSICRIISRQKVWGLYFLQKKTFLGFGRVTGKPTNSRKRRHFSSHCWERELIRVIFLDISRSSRVQTRLEEKKKLTRLLIPAWVRERVFSSPNATTPPPDPFTILEPCHPSIGLSILHKIRKLADFKALKFWKCRSGAWSGRVTTAASTVATTRTGIWGHTSYSDIAGRWLQ